MEKEIEDLKRQVGYLTNENEQLKKDIEWYETAYKECHAEIKRLRACIRDMSKEGETYE